MNLKNKKKLLVLSIILLVVFILITLVCLFKFNNMDDSNIKPKAFSICGKINLSKNKKENFIIILMSKQDANGDLIDAVTNFKNLYKSETIIYNLDFNKINDQCVKQIIEETGTYDSLKENSSVSSIIAYKDGLYKGMIQNAADEYSIEDYLVKLGVITKKEIKEDISYEDYEKNINLDEYLLLVVSEENVRTEVSKNMNDVFSNIKHDTINKRSVVGEKIFKNIEDNFEPMNRFPQVFYFKNGKIITSGSVFSAKSFKEFKTQIESK